MAKLDLIIENIRDEYMINLLEEGEISELETLKTKKFLNESLSRIRGMLVEEGALDAVKGHLQNNWGKYLAGAGAGAAGVGLGNEVAGDPGVQMAQMGNQIGVSGPGDVASAAAQAVPGALQRMGENFVDQAGNIYDQAGNIIGKLADQAADAAGQAGEAISDAAGQAGEAIGDVAGQAGDAINNMM